MEGTAGVEPEAPARDVMRSLRVSELRRWRDVSVRLWFSGSWLTVWTLRPFDIRLQEYISQSTHLHNTGRHQARKAARDTEMRHTMRKMMVHIWHLLLVWISLEIWPRTASIRDCTAVTSSSMSSMSLRRGEEHEGKEGSGGGGARGGGDGPHTAQSESNCKVPPLRATAWACCP